MASSTSQMKSELDQLAGLVSDDTKSKSEQEFILSFDSIIKRAEEGDPKSQLLVGLAKLEGWFGCALDTKDGEKWIVKAKNSVESPTKNVALGICCQYAIGDVANKDNKKAAAYYSQAANEEDILGMYSMANIFLTEELTTINKNKQNAEGMMALFNSLDTVAMQHTTANVLMTHQFVMAADKIYAGRKIIENKERLEQIMQLFHACSKTGFAPATERLATIYYFGYGGNVNQNLALQYFRDAANAGVLSARVGLCNNTFDDALGLSNDEIKKWYDLAIGQGGKPTYRSSLCCTIL